MTLPYSKFAQELEVETAFTVLAEARRLKQAGKDVIELEIGDSPFPTPQAAQDAAIECIRTGHIHYGPSIGLPELRQAAAEMVRRDFGVEVGAEHITVGPGAKVFQVLFALAFLDPGDDVLVFEPYFPTYIPNIEARGARVHLAPLRQQNRFRPDPEDIRRFLAQAPRPKAIVLNSPHNPTGGVLTREDIDTLAELLADWDGMLLSDEPYCHMVWAGPHHTPLQHPRLFPKTVAAYTFSKSYSMSGWRLGFSVAEPEVAQMLGNMMNVTLSCVPPMIQLAGKAALEHAQREREEMMAQFRRKVERLARGLQQLEGVRCLVPEGAFYVFPNVAAVCNRLGITSHGLAMYLLQGADDHLGVACLGGECFGRAGAGFLRLSCAEPDRRIEQALEFFAEAWNRPERVSRFLQHYPQYRLHEPYPLPDPS